MSLLLATLAAICFGVAVALQQHEATSLDGARSMHPSLLIRLARKPAWLAGMVGDVAGFIFQTAALATGAVIVVQPILTTSLVVALFGAALLRGQRLSPAEWRAVAMTVIGLITFLHVAQPTAHSDAVAGGGQWFALALVVGAAVVLAAVLGSTMDDVRRAAAFAVAAALAEAVMAVLAKAFGDRVGLGIGATLRNWTPYALVVCGIVTLLIVQSAYQVGRPTVTLPLIAVLEPVAASIIGVSLFHERIVLAGWRAPVVVAAAIVTAAGVATLARVTADDHTALART